MRRPTAARTTVGLLGNIWILRYPRHRQFYSAACERGEEGGHGVGGEGGEGEGETRETRERGKKNIIWTDRQTDRHTYC